MVILTSKFLLPVNSNEKFNCYHLKCFIFQELIKRTIKSQDQKSCWKNRARTVSTCLNNWLVAFESKKFLFSKILTHTHIHGRQKAHAQNELLYKTPCAEARQTHCAFAVNRESNSLATLQFVHWNAERRKSTTYFYVHYTNIKVWLIKLEISVRPISGSRMNAFCCAFRFYANRVWSGL